MFIERATSKRFFLAPWERNVLDFEQPQVFPAFIRRTNLLFIPGILPLVLMIFWLSWIRFTKAYKSKAVPGSGTAALFHS
jgi:hypothetical protein